MRGMVGKQKETRFPLFRCIRLWYFDKLYSQTLLTNFTHKLYSQILLTNFTHKLYSQTLLTHNQNFTHKLYSQTLLTNFTHKPHKPHKLYSQTLLTNFTHKLYSIILLKYRRVVCLINIKHMLFLSPTLNIFLAILL